MRIEIAVETGTMPRLDLPQSSEDVGVKLELCDPLPPHLPSTATCLRVHTHRQARTVGARKQK